MDDNSNNNKIITQLKICNVFLFILIILKTIRIYWGVG